MSDAKLWRVPIANDGTRHPNWSGAAEGYAGYVTVRADDQDELAEKVDTLRAYYREEHGWEVGEPERFEKA